MTTPAMSAALKEALATAPAGEVYISTLVFRSYDDAGQPLPIYIFDGDDTGQPWVAPLVAGGPPVTFLACQHELTLPEQTDGAMAPDMTLAIDNVSGILAGPIDNALKAGKPINVEWRAYLASDPTGPQTNPPLILSLGEPTLTSLRATARANIPNIGNRKFPAKTATPAVFPALQS